MNEKTKKLVRSRAIESFKDPENEIARIERDPNRTALFEALTKFMDDLEKLPKAQREKELDAAIDALDALAAEKRKRRARRRLS